jgi:hypothetical protein
MSHHFTFININSSLTTSTPRNKNLVFQKVANMFSFKSIFFTTLLVSSSNAGSTSLRSSVPDFSRRLSFQDIAGYAPQTLVTDHVSHNWRWVCVG